MKEIISDKKEAIYKASIKLLYANGFQSTPMSLVAKEAGVAAGTIYLHFKNKDDMLNKLYLQIKEEYRNSLMKDYSDSMPVKDAFELVFRNSINFMFQNRDEFSVMEQFKNSPFIRQETVEEGLKIFEPVLKLIDRAKKEKIIRDLPNSVIYALFFAPAGEIAKVHLRQGTKLIDKEIQLTFQGCWDALKN